MRARRNYDERIADFVINDALPHEFLPLIYVMTGDRAYNYFNGDSPYEYVGIHLLDTHDILAYPGKNPPYLKIYERYYNNDLDEMPSEDDKPYDFPRVCVASREWWRWLSEVTNNSGPFSDVFDVVFLPQIHEVPIVRAIHPWMLRMVSKNIYPGWMRRADIKCASGNYAMGYFWVYRTLKLFAEEEFEWDFNALMLEYGSAIAKRCAYDSEFKPTWHEIKVDYHAERLRATRAWEQSKLPKKPRQELIIEADKIIKRHRSELI